MNVFFRGGQAEEEESENLSGRRFTKAKTADSLTAGSSDKRQRKKKEPPKPWTKKDRYLVFFVLLTTVLTSAVLALSAREWKLPGFPRISISSLSPFKNETIVFEGNRESAALKMKEKSNEIIKNFREATKDKSGVYGLYVVDLLNGYSFGINENEKFTAASLIKLPVIAGFYQLAESGGINLDDKYTLKDSDKIAGSGSLYSKSAGYQISWRNLILLMAKQSDNTAFNICRKKLGDDEVESTARKIGMSDTLLSDNFTTPRDVGTFFEELWKGNIVKDKDKEEIIAGMTDTIYEQWLAAGIPEDVRVSHKYGREVHVVNDAGIVFAKRPYVVVILTKGIVEREADEIFPRLSRIVYEGMTSE